jgi:hypothetical protein
VGGGGAATNFAAGSAASPGLCVTGDISTGLFQATSNELSISASESEIARFDNPGAAVLTDYFDFTGSSVGGAPTPATIGMHAAGTDPNITMELIPKGTGLVAVSGSFLLMRQWVRARSSRQPLTLMRWRSPFYQNK